MEFSYDNKVNYKNITDCVETIYKKSVITVSELHNFSINHYAVKNSLKSNTISYQDLENEIDSRCNRFTRKVVSPKLIKQQSFTFEGSFEDETTDPD